MAHRAPQIQIIDKTDYTKQQLVPVPNAYPLQPLSPNSIRIQSRILSLSTNTFTYARFGSVLGWWDVWPIPAALSIDTDKYGRISAWGYAEVIETTHSQVPLGTKLFGYLPIGTYPETLEVSLDPSTGHVLETSARRRKQMTTYNRYFPSYPPETGLSEEDRDAQGWSAVMRVLFGTSYTINRYAFSWDDAGRAHPLGDASASWSARDADLAGAVVVLLAPSGKTGLCFAHQLRHARPVDKQPAKIVAVGSAASRDFSMGTGLFDDVLLYEDVGTSDIATKLGILGKETKVLLVNFGARGDADIKWYTALKHAAGSVIALLVGGDPKAEGRPKLFALVGNPTSGVVRCNASGLRDLAVKKEKEPSRYWDDLEKEWNRFTQAGAVRGLTLQWGKGIEEFKDGWDALVRGEADSAVGLVYEL